MKATPVTDNLTQLTRAHFVNAYLVREDDGLTLVDTTMSGATDDLIAAAQAVGTPIVRIALTHGHGDHIGSLDALKERLGDSVQVLIPELDARIHAGEKIVEGKLPGAWPTVKTTPDVRLNEGDRVGKVAVSNHFYWRFPFAAMATWEKSKDAASAKALRALEPQILVVGHGPAVRQPGIPMDRAIARAAS
jgi:metal-dependent hydrolase (beta-lactamase superfamily II)